MRMSPPLRSTSALRIAGTLRMLAWYSESPAMRQPSAGMRSMEAIRPMTLAKRALVLSSAAPRTAAVVMPAASHSATGTPRITWPGSDSAMNATTSPPSVSLSSSSLRASPSR